MAVNPRAEARLVEAGRAGRATRSAPRCQDYADVANASGSCCVSSTRTAPPSGTPPRTSPRPATRTSASGAAPPSASPRSSPGRPRSTSGAAPASTARVRRRRRGRQSHRRRHDPRCSPAEGAKRRQLPASPPRVPPRRDREPACGDATVDAVISNCVINLSPDKPRVLREAPRAAARGRPPSPTSSPRRAPRAPQDRGGAQLLSCGRARLLRTYSTCSSRPGSRTCASRKRRRARSSSRTDARIGRGEPRRSSAKRHREETRRRGSIVRGWIRIHPRVVGARGVRDVGVARAAGTSVKAAGPVGAPSPSSSTPSPPSRGPSASIPRGTPTRTPRTKTRRGRTSPSPRRRRRRGADKRRGG